MRSDVVPGDCLDVMRGMEADSVSAVVCDPPYGLEFMGRDWDRLDGGFSKPGIGERSTSWPNISGDEFEGYNPTCKTCGGRLRGKKKCECPAPDWYVKGRSLRASAVPKPGNIGGFADGGKPSFERVKRHLPAMQEWHRAWAAEALRVAKPGAHLLAFGGTRTVHRLAAGIEDAGWEIRDCLMFMYGSGFPKSHNLDKTGDFCACDDSVRRVRSAVPDGPADPAPREGADLLKELQREAADQGADTALSQGARGLDGGEPRQLPSEDARGTQPGVEGRRHLPAPQRQLSDRPVRSVSPLGDHDGSEGRLRDGAPSGDGRVGRPTATQDGGSPSPRPRPTEQRAGEPRIVAGQPEPQTRGAWPVCGRCGKPRIPRGLGTALKPAWEPIILARKPLVDTVAANVAAHGTGALNVDGCRIPADYANEPGRGPGWLASGRDAKPHDRRSQVPDNEPGTVADRVSPLGRWPANVVLDEEAAAALDAQSGTLVSGANPERRGSNKFATTYGDFAGQRECEPARGLDVGGASRFFYCAKASRAEREAGLSGPESPMLWSAGTQNPGSFQSPNTHRAARNHHPTVKPVALMRWLVRLVTPAGGLVLDPFTGSGTTGIACALEGFDFLGIEREAEYVEIARKRIAHARQQRSLWETP